MDAQSLSSHIMVGAMFLLGCNIHVNPSLVRYVRYLVIPADAFQPGYCSPHLTAITAVYFHPVRVGAFRSLNDVS